jgi:hypothetical protein
MQVMVTAHYLRRRKRAADFEISPKNKDWFSITPDRLALGRQVDSRPFMSFSWSFTGPWHAGRLNSRLRFDKPQSRWASPTTEPISEMRASLVLDDGKRLQQWNSVRVRMKCNFWISGWSRDAHVRVDRHRGDRSNNLEGLTNLQRRSAARCHVQRIFRCKTAFCPH